MNRFVWILIGLLILLQQDYWQWQSTTLVWGFMPVTLLYHVGISIAVAMVWLLAVRRCWPVDSCTQDDSC